MKNSMETAKNVDMSPRQSHGEIEAGGVKRTTVNLKSSNDQKTVIAEANLDQE